MEIGFGTLKMKLRRHLRDTFVLKPCQNKIRISEYIFSGKQSKKLNVVHVIMIQENYFQVPRRIDNAFRDKKPSHLNDILID